MKISALVSVVAAGRKARDAQSLFNKTFGDQSINVNERKSAFSETNSLHMIAQFYMQATGKILKLFARTVR